MNAPTPRGPFVAAALERRIDQACDQFEAAWKEGRSPRIEDFLQQCPAGERALLLRELVVLEIAYRVAAGADPGPAEYLARFPDLDAAWLASAIGRERKQPSVATVPMGPPPAPAPPPAPPPAPVPIATPARQIRCPHCHNPIQIGDRQPDEVLCPGCGSSFRVRDARRTESVTSMRLGKFELLERVGLGAFGAVWRARDTELDRVVALKVPHAGLAMTAEELQRVQDEARKLAHLRHPGIVTVHEIATLQGLPVIVSEFIQGAPLSELLEVRRLTFRESATLMVDVAEALNYAHDQGVVHRDVKPANLMVEHGRAVPGGTAASALGKPLILDFGLALREQAAVTLTMDGQIVGTPAYMSPEQAAGKGHEADRRSDVFSLGVVLYELLCAELPFRGSRTMLLHQVRVEEPRPPRQVNDKIPKDLETICLKAMAKEPQRRYQTALALADDLRRFLRGEVIHARPVGKVERLWRWCRRNPLPATLTAAVFLLLSVLAGGATTAAIRIDGLRRGAEQERQRAEGHFTKTLNMVDLLIQAARKALDNTPRMGESQVRLLTDAQTHLTELLADRPNDPAVRMKLALAHQGLGFIWARNGDYDRARDAYTRAVDGFRQLARDSSQEEDFCRSHDADCQNELGEIMRLKTSFTEARRHYDRGLALLEPLLDRFPEHHFLSGKIEDNVGLMLLESRGEDVEQHFAAAARHLRRSPVRPERQAELARLDINRGNFFFTRQEYRSAILCYRRAIGFLERLKEEHPDNHEYQHKLGLTRNNEGLALRMSGQLVEARQAHEKALPLFTRLEENYPQQHLYRMELAKTYQSLGSVLWSLHVAAAGAGAVTGVPIHGFRPAPIPAVLVVGLVPEARTDLLKANALFEKLARNPGLAEYQREAAGNLYALASQAFWAGNWAEARRFLDRAIPLQEAALAANPKHPYYLRFLSEQYQFQARLQARQEPVSAIRQLARRAADVEDDLRFLEAERLKRAGQLAQAAVALFDGLSPEVHATLLSEIHASRDSGEADDWRAIRPLLKRGTAKQGPPARDR